MSGVPSVIFPLNISFQIICCLLGEEIALNILPTIKKADSCFDEFRNKSAYYYAHFLLGYCAYETNNPSWLETINDNEIAIATRIAYNYIYVNCKDGQNKNNSNDD